jgi:hypothetical protein
VALLAHHRSSPASASASEGASCVLSRSTSRRAA